MKVHKNLGPGFLENVYGEALSLELRKASIPFEREKKLNIKYEDTILEKFYKADFYCYDSIVLELKAMKYLSQNEVAITQNYLKATNQPIGLLVSFGAASLLYKRIYNNSHVLNCGNQVNQEVIKKIK